MEYSLDLLLMLNFMSSVDALVCVGSSWFQGSQEGDKLCRARSWGRSCQSKQLPPRERQSGPSLFSSCLQKALKLGFKSFQVKLKGTGPGRKVI